MKEFAALQDMSQMPVMERLINALIVTALGMGITFIVLILLLFAIKAMSRLLNPVKAPTDLVKDQPQAKKEPLQVVSQDDEEELIAILIAAIAASSGQSQDQIKIRGYREVGNNIPLWSQAGVLETMNREIY